MLRINLLPKELQSAAKTPVVIFATVVAGVTLTLVAVCILCYLWFKVVVLKERLERKRDEVSQLQRHASEVDALLEDIADYKEREKAIISVKTNRILWSKKIDELIQLTPGFIWIVRLEMRELDANEYKWEEKVPQFGGYLRMLCYSAGNDVQRMTVFRERLKGTDDFYLSFLEDSIKPENFFSDFVNISRPEWRFVRLPGYREPNNLKFSVRLELRPLVAREERKAT
jgi:hypothetical protein